VKESVDGIAEGLDGALKARSRAKYRPPTVHGHQAKEYLPQSSPTHAQCFLPASKAGGRGISLRIAPKILAMTGRPRVLQTPIRKTHEMEVKKRIRVDVQRETEEQVAHRGIT